MSDVISSFRRLRAGLQVFALLMLFLCVILHTIWSSKSLTLLCTLPFAISKFVKIMLVVCMLVGMVVWAGGYGGRCESGLWVFRELCPVSFLVVGESPSVLL